MVVFSSYAAQVAGAFLSLIAIFFLLPRAVVSMRRIAEVVNTETRIQNGPVSEAGSDAPGTVEFRHVSFRYPGAREYVLSDIS